MTSYLVRCRNYQVCDLPCGHKEPHEHFKDGGCLACDYHVHVCLGLNGQRLPSKFDGKCIIVSVGIPDVKHDDPYNVHKQIERFQVPTAEY